MPVMLFDYPAAISYLGAMIDERTIFIAFDTETTGLATATGRVVEIAALKFDWNGTILDRFSELVRPPGEIPETAIAIHHITDEMVADKPGIDQVLPRFLVFLGGDQTVLLAQNALFDIGFINHEAIRSGIGLPRNVILDQIEVTRRIYRDLPTYSLESTCRRFNLVERQDHRAMADAVLVMKLFRHCLKQVRPEEGMEILNSLFHYTFGGPMAARIDEAMLDTVVAALESGGTLEIIYSAGTMKGMPRKIMPTLMYTRDGVAYLTARCLRTGASRQFRLDRIRTCRLVLESTPG